jgi:DNA-binding protein YbaB
MTTPSGLGNFSRDPDEAQRQMDQWAQGFAAKAERYQAAQARTEQLRLSATSDGGAVKVTVGADGGVTDLAFTTKARSIPLDELSAQILSTMRRAQAGIATQVSEVMTEQLGDEDQQTRTLLLDNLRTRFPEQDEEDPAADDAPFAAPEAGASATPPPPTPPAPPAPPTPPAAQPPQAPRPPRRPGTPDEDDENSPW